MSTFLQDLRFALRNLAKAPGFAAVAVLTLAVGIGANTTVYSWIQGVLFAPLRGVPDQRGLVVLGGESRGGESMSLSVPDFRDLQAGELPLAGVLASEIQAMSLTVGEQPERIWGSIVSGDFFDVLGVPAAAGRTFRPEEDVTAGTHPVAVLSHRFWQRRFQGDPGIVGRTVLLNGHAFTVVGVAARGFHGDRMGLSLDLWVPLAVQPLVVAGDDRLTERGNHWLQGLARLPEGTTLAEAQAALDGLSAQLARAYPETNQGNRLVLYRFWNAPSGPSKALLPVLAVLAAMVALLLLLACANVANLLLVRALGRRREIAVRLALGASRSRLARQLLAESLALAVPAGVLGVLLARWATGLLAVMVPPTDAPVAPSFPLDAWVLAFAALVSLATAVLFSLAPVLEVTAPATAGTLREEGTALAGSARKARLRSGLVVAQVAFSFLLILAAGLFVRSLGRAADLDPGFAARDVLLASIDLFPGGYDEERGNALYRELLERVAALPGVEGATLASRIPLDFGGSSSSYLEVDGYQPAPDEEMIVRYYKIGPDYLRTLGIPLAAGRDLRAADDAQAPRTLVVNETMAKRYWPGRQALGGKVRLGESEYTVVGIARDGKYRSLSEPPMPFFYLPVLQSHRTEMVLHVRTAGDPLALAGPVREVVRRLDPNLPLATVKTLREHLRIAVFSQRLAASFLGAFGVLALLLATVGLYSVVRYAVSQRTRELGVRLALGADRRDVARMVVGQGMALVGIGAAVGLLAAFGTTRFLESLLLGVSGTDPLAFLGAAAVLAGVTALASWLPARRAAAVDPAVVLRAE